ncbi:hypothetical protein OOZ15_10270 [Galbibacter sp. EGI 63066]|uniref:hypothetical protein n=1 Tax=Galbibacter sp. EGI 63066 TaxID=2993559 RepID=UPI002248AA75|nr:hypothetical protein [Galbibacter sp. EGI 63066]MCX2680325.1 hypothetical protein [Galbibacter sp. EGI 63066]
MKKASNISHPLKNRSGLSQKNRVKQALLPDSVAIDGKTLADRLYLISEYAKQINFYDHKKDGSEGEFQEISNWVAFFNNSLPFKLAVLSKTDTNELETQFLLLSKELKNNPSKQTLESLLEFIYNKIILPVSTLFNVVEKNQNSFSTSLLSIIKSSFAEPLKSFIGLYNASATFLCVRKRNFNAFLNLPWQLKVEDIYAIEICIQQEKKGKKGAFLKAEAILNTIFYQMLSGFNQITETTPDFIEESLYPLEESLQKKHQPHLALLFTFLEIFKYFQGNLNELGKKHLDFFYEKVLKMIPKEAVPDKAHIVFEVAKHLDEYPLPKDLLLKDGKDINKQDIRFGLDHEIILDKARIKDLRTLSLNPIRDGDNGYIEGVYMAPVANSTDGKGKKFQKEQSPNWATLGAKYSKFIQEGNNIPDQHPQARLGFVLASPVLFLQEGERTIKIFLNCNMGSGASEISKLITNAKTVYTLTDGCIDELSITAKTYVTQILAKQNPYTFDDKKKFLDTRDPVSCDYIFNDKDRHNIMRCIHSSSPVDMPLFKVRFSGEEEWIEGTPEIKINNPPFAELSSPGEIQFELNITLEADKPAVTFFNEEVLKEKIDLKENFPVVKIELNKDLKIDLTQEDEGTETDEDSEEKCCLKKRREENNLSNISPYHFLQQLKLVNAKIDVNVCGVKNLIVQNDENLQDVNKPIYPFGPRPKVGEDWFVDGGADFYIGSREVFCKNWKKFWINTEWKDKPLDLHEHYRFYRDPNFENGDKAITELSFRFLTSILYNGEWVKDSINNNKPPQPTTTDGSEVTEHDKNYSANYNPGELMPLFESVQIENNPCESISISDKTTYGHQINEDFFDGNGYSYSPKSMPIEPLQPLTVNSRKGFVKLTLAGISFQHERFTHVLTRQMMALANLVDPKSIEEALDKLEQAETLCDESENRIDEIKSWSDTLDDLKDEVKKSPPPPPFRPSDIPDTLPDDLSPYGLEKIGESLCDRITAIKNKFDNEAVAGIPKEPYTPIIKNLSIDYNAVANINDIDIIHLYPYENTSKYEDIEQNPTLFPFFDDEGTLFIGIENLTLGGQLSVLFQLAEATADSESDRAEIKWHYLTNNNWQTLEPDFDILSDETDGLTVSGIVTIAVPAEISKTGNTIMPDNLYWIKVSAGKNVKSVAETIGIHTQAAKTSARFSELSDKTRLDTALAAGSVAKLVESDFSVKKVEQLYPSFGGRLPEASGHFYVRVSEHLKHKGRGVTIHDYERIVLEGFPEVYKVKCISHTMGLSANSYRRDLEIAPGYTVVAVIPDLTKLKSGNQLEPKVPVSLLEKISRHLRKKTSPFARIKIMNPRYEYVNVTIAVTLHKGKSHSFYSKKLKEDITLFLAPWFLGDSEKIAFGQVVLFSDIVGFVEQLEYVDYIKNLELKGECDQTGDIIKPLTARSVLTGGDICVSIVEEECIECDDEPIREPQIIN